MEDIGAGVYLANNTEDIIFGSGLLQVESLQMVEPYSLLVVGLLQDGDEEVRDDMATSVGAILSSLPPSVGGSLIGVNPLLLTCFFGLCINVAVSISGLCYCELAQESSHLNYTMYFFDAATRNGVHAREVHEISKVMLLWSLTMLMSLPVIFRERHGHSESKFIIGSSIIPLISASHTAPAATHSHRHSTASGGSGVNPAGEEPQR